MALYEAQSCTSVNVLQLPTSVYKKVLVMLPDKVIPFMPNPRLLADFLTLSDDIGELSPAPVGRLPHP